jgi:hypothetical protein
MHHILEPVIRTRGSEASIIMTRTIIIKAFPVFHIVHPYQVMKSTKYAVRLEVMEIPRKDSEP